MFSSSNKSPSPSRPSTTTFTRPPDFSKLLLCVAIDVIGSSSELVPILGEVTDVVWAPIAAVLLRNLYGGSNVVLVLEFAEEILPLTDILPLATLCWIIDTLAPSSELAKLLQLGIYRADYYDNDVVDVRSQESAPRQLKSANVKDDDK